MEFKEVVGRRRSIRYYQPWRPVEREKIQTILEAARLSSRAVNASFSKAIVVYRDHLSEAERQSLQSPTTTAQLDMAPVYIFWYADLEAVAKAMERGTLKQLVDVGALNPSHGWSHEYVEHVIYPQVLQPIADDPQLLPLVCAIEATLPICQALLCAFDEGLGASLSAFNIAAAKRLFNIPDTLLPIWMMFLGYPAESPEAGGQRPREPLEEMFCEGKYGTPFQSDPKVVERLRALKMIHDTAPLPWRKEEVRALSRMFGLPE